MVNFALSGSTSNWVKSDVEILNTNYKSLIGTDTQISCNAYTWIDGKTYTSSNNSAIFPFFKGSFQGCDSLAKLNLTIPEINKNVIVDGQTITSSAAVADYKWLDCNNSNAVIPNEIDQTFNAEFTGSYAVEITVNGCVDTSDCVDITVLGNAENKNPVSFSLYPNPTHGNVSLMFEEYQSFIEVKITSATGKIVETKTFANTNRVNFELNQPAGIYFMELIDADGKKSFAKIIKE